MIKKLRDISLLDTIILCITAETIFRTYHYELSLINSNKIMYFVLKTLSKLQINQLFQPLSNHILDQSLLENEIV